MSEKDGLIRSSISARGRRRNEEGREKKKKKNKKKTKKKKEKPKERAMTPQEQKHLLRVLPDNKISHIGEDRGGVRLRFASWGRRRSAILPKGNRRLAFDKEKTLTLSKKVEEDEWGKADWGGYSDRIEEVPD